MSTNGDYEYEIFLSYRRQRPMSAWVQTYFYEELTQWLASELPTHPRIFLDIQGIETGDDWPLRLRNALLRSCLLVAVWSPSYFRSHWCVAELHTMLAREQELSMRSETDPRGLVFPVKFGGRLFPPEVARIELRDFSDWAFTAPAFRDSAKYLDFQASVQEFVRLLVRRLDEAPPWQPDWPVATPEPERPQNAPLPRL